jgi:hypothetical protein
LVIGKDKFQAPEMNSEDCVQDRLPEFETSARVGMTSPMAHGDCVKMFVHRANGSIGRSFTKSVTIYRNKIIRTRSRGESSPHDDERAHPIHEDCDSPSDMQNARGV